MMRKENKINRKNLVLLVVLSLILAATLVGCKKPVEEKPTPSNSEVVSEVVSEPISEEVSEPTSEAISEVVSEEPSEEADIDLSQYTEANGKYIIDLIEDMDYNEFKIIVWRNGVGAEAILSNGDSYQIQEESNNLALYFPNAMTDIKYEEYIVHVFLKREDLYGGSIISSGENQEVTFTGTDVDGKEYEITVYITLEG